MNNCGGHHHHHLRRFSKSVFTGKKIKWQHRKFIHSLTLIGNQSMKRRAERAMKILHTTPAQTIKSAPNGGGSGSGRRQRQRKTKPNYPKIQAQKGRNLVLVLLLFSFRLWCTIFLPLLVDSSPESKTKQEEEEEKEGKQTTPQQWDKTHCGGTLFCSVSAQWWSKSTSFRCRSKSDGKVVVLLGQCLSAGEGEG